MTAQLKSQPDITTCFNPGNAHLAPHLTEEQFGELLCASSAIENASPAQAHLLVCEQCASELAGLRNSLALFHEASTAYADNQLRRLPQISIPAARPILPVLLEPAYFLAMAAILLAAILPIQTWHRHFAPQVPASTVSVQDRPAESDDALLEDVNRDLSASVPAPMQALADPTGAAEIQTSIQNPDQRNIQP
jgi:hypothetical protein